MELKEKESYEPQEGDIVMIDSSKGPITKTFVRKAIQFFTGAKYHHAGIVVFDKKENTLYIQESVFNGFIKTMPIKEYIEKNKQYDLVVFRSSSKIQDFNIKLSILDQAPYDFSSLIIFQVIFQTIKKIFRKGLWLGRTGIAALNKVYCTEAIAFVIGMPKYWTVGPMQLYNYLSISTTYRKILIDKQ